MNSQRGITITGFLVFAVLLISVLLLGFKIGPAYMEYHTIQKMFRTMAADPSIKNATRGEFNSAFNARAGVDNVKVIGYDDVQIEKDGDGIVISAEYTVRVPLFSNLSALMEFRPTSRQ